jgi:hypothetical protein
MKDGPDLTTKHDWAFWLTIYSVALNIFLLGVLLVFFIASFRRAEWNAGCIACDQNPGVVEIHKDAPPPKGAKK